MNLVFNKTQGGMMVSQAEAGMLRVHNRLKSSVTLT